MRRIRIQAGARVAGLPQVGADRGATYNAGVSAPVRIDELARRVIAATGSRSRIAYVPDDQAYGAGYEELGQPTPGTHARTGWQATRSIDHVVAARMPRVTVPCRLTRRERVDAPAFG